MSAGLILLLWAAPAGAATDAADIAGVAGRRIETEEDAMARAMRDRLARDPRAAAALAQRILASRLGEKLSDAEDGDAAAAQIQGWIENNPESAGYLAVGFARDDREGGDTFERSLFERISRHFALSENRHKGILGRLDAVAAESKLLSSLDEVDDEQRGRALADFFRGQGRTGHERIENADEIGAPTPAHSPAAAGGLYDRLSAANVGGYSPDVMTFQSTMNNRRPPGAPRLIETGKLDYPTLRQPYYGLKYDIDNLDRAYRAQRAWAQARRLGKEHAFSREQYEDPAVQERLDKEAGGRDPDEFFAPRRAAIRDAEGALLSFDREAERAKRLSGITAARIRTLSAKRRDAARRIALAKLLERVQRLGELEGFLTPALRSLIEDLPVDGPLKYAYLERGRRLREEIAAERFKAMAAANLLRSGDDASLIRAEAGMARAAAAVKKFTTLSSEYREVPLAVEAEPTGWRAALDRLAAEHLTFMRYGKARRAEIAARAKTRAALRRIAGQK